MSCLLSINYYSFVAPSQYKAELSLQDVGIKHRHLRVEESEAKVMTVGSLAVACKRRDTVRMGEGSGLSMNLAFQSRIEEQMTQCAVDTGDGEVTHELIVDRLMMVTEIQNCDEGAG